MTTTTISPDLEALYRRAFREFRTLALWNVRELERPTMHQAMLVARSLRTEGNLAARRLAEAIEKACGAAH